MWPGLAYLARVPSTRSHQRLESELVWYCCITLVRIQWLCVQHDLRGNNGKMLHSVTVVTGNLLKSPIE